MSAADLEQADWPAWSQRTHDELLGQGVQFTSGFGSAEVDACELEFRTPVPPEFASFLAVGVPVSERWARWAEGPAVVAEDARSWLDRAFAFDIRNNGFWHERFGHRPAGDEAAVAAALAVVHAAPPLLPIYAHRFLATQPTAGPLPVLSVWQANDSTIYGNDLADYFHREFGVSRPSWAAADVNDIPVWGDLLSIFDDPT